MRIREARGAAANPPADGFGQGQSGSGRRGRRGVRQSNPRQRQGMLLVVIALIGLVVVFVLIANYVNNVSKQVGSKVDVLVLAQPLKAFEPVTSAVLAEDSVPAKWTPRGAMTSPSDALGLITRVPLPAGTELQQGMLTGVPSLAAGQREVAILVGSDTGVAGQIQPGDRVDIIATYQGGNGSTGGPTRNTAQLVVPGAEVLDIGQVTSAQTGTQGGVPVTFALTPAQALQVSYAESFAAKVRLSLVADNSPNATTGEPSYSPQG